MTRKEKNLVELAVNLAVKAEELKKQKDLKNHSILKAVLNKFSMKHPTLKEYIPCVS